MYKNCIKQSHLTLIIVMIINYMLKNEILKTLWNTWFCLFSNKKLIKWIINDSVAINIICWKHIFLRNKTRTYNKWFIKLNVFICIIHMENNCISITYVLLCTDRTLIIILIIEKPLNSWTDCKLCTFYPLQRYVSVLGLNNLQNNIVSHSTLIGRKE